MLRPFLFLLLALAAPASAQLSGTYSIGPRGDFASPANAVAVLAEDGVSGPTTFLVEPGTYRGQVTIPAIAGASASSPVMFQASRSDQRPTLEHEAAGTADNWVISIDGASHITFDGFVISPQGTTYARGIALDDAAKVTVRNSQFQAIKLEPAAGSDQEGMYVFESDDVVISDNEFLAPPLAPDTDSYAINGYTSQRLAIQGNTIESRRRAILIFATDDPVVESNRVEGQLSLSSVNGGTVAGNVIHSAQTFAVTASSLTGTAVAPVQVVNNTISSGFSLTVILNVAEHVRFVHNTLYSDLAAGGGILLSISGGDQMTVERNLFHTEGDGLCIRYVDAADIASSDHNVFSQAVAGSFAYIGNRYHSTISSLRSFTAFGDASALVQGAAAATFADPASLDFHLAGTSDGDRALLVSRDPTLGRDIDSEPRPFATYAGADEATSFDPLVGTYSVYGPGADFATLQDATDEVSLLGMGGAVTFDLVQPASGTEHTVHVEIPAIPGATSTNRLTVSGRSLESPIAHNAVTETDNWIIRLDGTAHVTFVGIWFRTDLGVTDDYDRAVWLDGAVEDIEFVLCRFSGDTDADIGEGLGQELVFGEGAAQDVTFQLNEFVGGAHGVFHSGAFPNRASGFQFVATGGSVPGNVFTDQSESAIYLSNHLAPSIVDIVSTSEEYGGGGLSLLSGLDGRIERAVVRAGGTFSNALTLIGWSGGVDEGLQVVNSSFDAVVRGARIRNSESVQLRHNTFRTSGSGFGTLVVETSIPRTGDITAVHNVIVSDGDQPAVVTEAGNLDGAANNLYTNGPEIADADATGYATLAAYQSATGQETGSVSVPVTFATAGAPELAGASVGDGRLGMPRLADVLTDFQGDARPEFTYLGADEADTPLVSGGGSLVLTAVLQGAYDAGTGLMRTALHDGGLVPLAQPYSDAAYDGTPLDYDGTETTTAQTLTEADAVDWVLVELRDTATGPASVRLAALLTADGSVVGADGQPLGITGTSAFVVVRHRNHGAAMTATAVDLSTLVDLSAGSGYGTGGMTEVASGVWALWAGDGSLDGQVTAPDFNVYGASGPAGYLVGDYTLDGQVTAPDFNVYSQNAAASAASAVPED